MIVCGVSYILYSFDVVHTSSDKANPNKFYTVISVKYRCSENRFIFMGLLVLTIYLNQFKVNTIFIDIIVMFLFFCLLAFFFLWLRIFPNNLLILSNFVHLCKVVKSTHIIWVFSFLVIQSSVIYYVISFLIEYCKFLVLILLLRNQSETSMYRFAGAHCCPCCSFWFLLVALNLKIVQIFLLFVPVLPINL